MDLKNPYNLMLNLFSKITKLFKIHLKSHYFPLDTMKHCSTVEQTTVDRSKTKLNWIDRFLANLQYAVPFFSLLFINVDTYFLFKRYDFVYNSTGIEELFTHKVFPAVMWPLGDLEMLIGIENEFAIYGLLLVLGPLPQGLLTYVLPHEGGHILIQNEKGF